jgi:hypothetical protein
MSKKLTETEADARNDEARDARAEADDLDRIAAKVVDLLKKAQERDLRKDTGHGYRSAREIAGAVGLRPAEARTLLHSLADAGRVRKLDAANGLFWRSITPLPWEPGGTMAIAAAREAELWAGDLNLMVQAFWTERGQTMSRDVKAYPEGLRERAEAHVRLENHKSDARRKDDRCSNLRLSHSYTPPPSYRLVALQPNEEASR